MFGIVCLVVRKSMSSIIFTKESTLYDYDGVLGKALLERRICVNGLCNQYDSCSVMDILWELLL